MLSGNNHTSPPSRKLWRKYVWSECSIPLLLFVVVVCKREVFLHRHLPENYEGSMSVGNIHSLPLLFFVMKMCQVGITMHHHLPENCVACSENTTTLCCGGYAYWSLCREHVECDIIIQKICFLCFRLLLREQWHVSPNH